ncbi:MAG: helix-turn-helix transcriptional regulator [Gemmiger sp.]|uniref:helix-turn-helix domain-containing protein n=1 Tax=Gemmiger sp. TaxID=2049027 RepID=UPI002E76C1A6|nr:helix-turn-helix transcriptional regulator [Gemmiger sp.]MEE0801284.1 helix-turn-helix transcriptional regulator [Gemmiger sp.]
MTKRTKFNETWFAVGQRVKECRKMRGMTRQQLVDAIESLPANNGKDRSEKQIGYIESGTRSMSTEYAVLISEALDVSIDYLQLKSDYKTETERSLAEFSNFKTEWQQRIDAMRVLAYLAGYEINLFEQNEGPYQIEKAIENIKEGYKIIKDGKVLATCTLERFNLLALDCQELVEQRIKSYVREVSD